MQTATIAMTAIAASVILVICCGVEGTDRPHGMPADTAASTLVVVAFEPAGAHCAHGGKHLTTGRDANRNGKLDAAEVRRSSYACIVGNDSDGGTAPSGDPRADALTVLTSLPLGDRYCAEGGSRQDSGIDANHDGGLEAGEIRSTTFACNAPPSNLARRDGAGAPALAETGTLATPALRPGVAVPGAARLDDPALAARAERPRGSTPARAASRVPGQSGRIEHDDAVERLRVSKRLLFDR